MHQKKTPPDPAAAEILNTVRASLLSLHKTLLDSERAVYERDIAPVQTPGQMLGLLMGDPFFAYLRDLSQFVVRIDEMLDAAEQPTTVTEARGMVAQARDLIRPSEDGGRFERRYFEAIQRDPNVLLAHAAVSRLLTDLQAE